MGLKALETGAPGPLWEQQETRTRAAHSSCRSVPGAPEGSPTSIILEWAWPALPVWDMVRGRGPGGQAGIWVKLEQGRSLPARGSRP